MAKGKKFAGRQKGTPNKSWTVRSLAEARGINVFEILLDVASGVMKCGTCHGELVTRIKLPEGSHADECWSRTGGKCSCNGFSDRPCQSCKQTGWEPINVDQRIKACAHVAKFIQPELKAIEVSGAEDKPPIGVRVVLVRAGA